MGRSTRGGFLIIDFPAGGGKFSHFELKNVPRKARFQSQNNENIVQKGPNFSPAALTVDWGGVYIHDITPYFEPHAPQAREKIGP